MHRSSPTHNSNLPVISSPKRQNYEKIVYKKFFLPCVPDEIRIPPFEYKLSIEKPFSNYHEKIAAYKKYTNGRVNCVSVIPNRDLNYVSKSRLKKKLKINIDLPKLKFLCKTPAHEFEILSPAINNFYEKKTKKVEEKTKSDAMMNTE